ncbi:hypothetical protein VN12_25080 [Pirellula sp. SH-Sr6A]|uniref:class I SAM-dependent methyltransferase n=1 Tax=Pirellula sp. SH-Sr6A TaxID=1632865 RepID=UPI00078DE043|nr:methyltransferase domain-containing protein [Pirellula sp. SH-Sr6A]AMV35388.1 hypothetical protein VN12_25080 [Pirellula sp. SH-Sr6A]
MRRFQVVILLSVWVLNHTGCSRKEDVAVEKSKINTTLHQELAHEAKSTRDESSSHENRHADHRHAFANPKELAKKWNDPTRDEWQHPEQIIGALSLESGQTVADIGAGTGYMVAHLSKVVGQDGTVIAVDAESAIIGYLTDHMTQLGPAKIVPNKVGFHDPELAPASVDAVVTLDTWHHVAGQEAYAQKVYNGLRPGGRFVVVDYAIDAETGPPKEMRLSPDDVIVQLEKGGFRAEVVSETMPRHYMVVGVKDKKLE